MKKTFAAAFTLAALSATANQAGALEIRFYPGERVYAYQLDGMRGTNSVLLHNIAVVNDGAAPVRLDEVAIELLSGGRPVETRTIGAAELASAAANGAELQRAALFDLLRFQFGGERLLPPGAVLSDDLNLDPGEAVLITSQAVAFRGAREAARVRVNGGVAARDLPISIEQSKIAYSFPLQGAWYVAAGSSFHTGHRWSPMEEFAYDFVQLGADLRTHRGKGTRFADYYAYREPVLAAAPGKVVIAINDEPENVAAMKRADETTEVYFERLQQEQFARIAGGGRGVGGSQVMIDHGNGEYSFYAHLKPGSVRVKEGDVVETGALLGLLGSSGNSTEPHLHFQVCDAPDPLLCAGVPVKWADVEPLFPDLPRALQSGDLVKKAAAH
ncbi:MAG: M23 family metallopeptidase [Pseudomonadota bacterium]